MDWITLGTLIFELCCPGMYTVMVAAMGRRVVAVDPILSNLGLINQSLQRANNAKHVSFVSNPIR